MKKFLKESLESFVEDKNFDYYISKETTDEEFIQWICDEFELKPETVLSIAEICDNDPMETYEIVNQQTDLKGYGFDQETDKDEDFYPEDE